jgi:hypothetical protein
MAGKEVMLHVDCSAAPIGCGYGPPVGIYASPNGVPVQLGPFSFWFR